ncbi:TIGR00268 family protein [candidate division LCP-89 bacterium B3_LCP]|uniref:TIGR00268 family protein n=1 Tax=candidate division LCP-89 bacterium B3_LCP TaxID=2012998 RepID=A0A532UY14_UNCL8|nr:MAG: TIGR00268 family protein [candidate division LCP-89 bacterium B3_LCP]
MRTPLEKENELRLMLRENGDLAVAFSGGVDSSYLLKVASEELRDNAIGVIAVSPTYPQREHQRASRMGQELGIRIFTIETDEMDCEDFTSNPTDRCYYCKTTLFDKLIQRAQAEGINHVADGSNLDDLGDHRPGMKALSELGVISPLRQCGMTKADIRERSRELGLETWDLPSFACLASRFPYGTEITPEALRKVETAENAFFERGFRLVRVRHYGDMARIELAPDELPRLFEDNIKEDLVHILKDAGYNYITVDLEGYRTGSMNEGIAQSTKTLI